VTSSDEDKKHVQPYLHIPYVFMTWQLNTRTTLTSVIGYHYVSPWLVEWYVVTAAVVPQVTL